MPVDGQDAAAGSRAGYAKVVPDIIRAISEYPVETDAGKVRCFRENLAHIGARLAMFSNETAAVEIEASASVLPASAVIGSWDERTWLVLSGADGLQFGGQEIEGSPARTSISPARSGT